MAFPQKVEIPAAVAAGENRFRRIHRHALDTDRQLFLQRIGKLRAQPFARIVYRRLRALDDTEP